MSMDPDSGDLLKLATEVELLIKVVSDSHIVEGHRHYRTDLWDKYEIRDE